MPKECGLKSGFACQDILPKSFLNTRLVRPLRARLSNEYSYRGEAGDTNSDHRLISGATHAWVFARVPSIAS